MTLKNASEAVKASGAHGREDGGTSLISSSGSVLGASSESGQSNRVLFYVQRPPSGLHGPDDSFVYVCVYRLAVQLKQTEQSSELFL
jgi:hypothetical protein